MENQKKYLIIAAVVFALFILLIIILSINHYNSPQRVVETVDQDTGETIITEPNKTPETQSQNKVILLGANTLLDNGLTQAQFLYAKETLINFTQETYGSEYEIIKVMPDSFRFDNKTMFFDIRLGNSDNFLKGELVLPDIYSVRVVVKDGENKKLDTGIVTTSDGYTGDGVPPEEHDH